MEKTKILIDEITDEPTNDFDKLSKTLSEIIKNSDPHFTIGIYGEWGTGKTTLMRSIKNNLIVNEQDLQKSKILPIWFNAWRYEREEQLATIAMMKTIAYGMTNHVKFDSVSKTIKKGLFILGKDIVRQLALQVITKKGVEEFENNFLEEQKFLSEMERDTIYFDGLNAISEQMKKIRDNEGGEDYRVVVFIDDLDRCSPKKALEVLESIKVFLDIDGFVYVLGISHETINKLITYAYKEIGVKGSDYIKKIIQIPIKLPSWEKRDLKKLIENNLSANLKNEYAQLIIQNSDIITDVVDNNPRQLKRFINNLIIAYETFADGENKMSLEVLFITQIIKKRAPNFYEIYVRNLEYRDIINDFLLILQRGGFMGESTRGPDWSYREEIERYRYISQLITEIISPEEKDNNSVYKNIVRAGMKELSHKRESQIDISPRFVDAIAEVLQKDWQILQKYADSITKISNWETYDNAIDIVEDIPLEKFTEND